MRAPLVRERVRKIVSAEPSARSAIPLDPDRSQSKDRTGADNRR